LRDKIKGKIYNIKFIHGKNSKKILVIKKEEKII
jgi:hypothetical protein